MSNNEEHGKHLEKWGWKETRGRMEERSDEQHGKHLEEVPVNPIL